MTKKGYSYVRKSFTFDGVRYEVSAPTEEAAIAKKLEKLRQLEEGRLDSAATVRQWAETWYETYVSHRKITDKSKRTYRACLDNVILPAIGSYRISKVTPVRLQQLLNTREGRSASDALKLRMTIKGLFSKAAAARLIPFDPSAELELPDVTAGKHRRLTDPERAALIRVANYPTFDGQPNLTGAWLMTILRCGLRPNETAALKKRCVDLPGRTLRVEAALESGGGRVKDPKTSAGVRTVPIPEDLVPWLERQIALSRSEFIFVQKDRRTPLTETSMRCRWNTVKKYMDLELGAEYARVKLPGARRRSLVILRSALAEDLDLYDLRHTYCTDLEIAGVPINVAKTLMGHRDIATTANIYTHAADATTAAARELINAAAPVVNAAPAPGTAAGTEKPAAPKT
ncbi:MAG: site-specific integrase [Oscillospiraceae bacterium]|nr:site-specific integrase [Oscillospiraceae bacterium]